MTAGASWREGLPMSDYYLDGHADLTLSAKLRAIYGETEELAATPGQLWERVEESGADKFDG